MIKLPYKGKVYLSSPYGNRNLFGYNEMHRGWDLVGKESKTILAPCDGTVIQSAYYTAPRYNGDLTYQWGNYVCIHSFEEGIDIYMCHMSERLVSIGDTVKAGQPIGHEGSTGLSTASHCHLEVRRNGQSINPSGVTNIANTVGIYENIEETKPEEPEGDDDMAKMTGEEIYNALVEYLASLPESDWSRNEGHWEKATDEKIVNGKNPRGFVTREQLTAVLGRKDLL